MGHDGPPTQNETQRKSKVGCIGRREEQGEEQEVSGSGQESMRDGWMNRGVKRGRNSSLNSVILNSAIKVGTELKLQTPAPSLINPRGANKEGVSGA